MRLQKLSGENGNPYLQLYKKNQYEIISYLFIGLFPNVQFLKENSVKVVDNNFQIRKKIFSAKFYRYMFCLVVK